MMILIELTENLVMSLYYMELQCHVCAIFSVEQIPKMCSFLIFDKPKYASSHSNTKC